MKVLKELCYVETDSQQKISLFSICHSGLVSILKSKQHKEQAGVVNLLVEALLLFDDVGFRFLFIWWSLINQLWLG